MIQITRHIAIPDDEIQVSFIRSSGPGGQNVNKVATAVQLRFNAAGSAALPEDVKDRLTKLAGSRMTGAGELVIEASRHRSQKANRADAIARLTALVRRALRKPTPRVPTRPTLGSRRRRLDAKKRRGETKRLRGGREQ